MKRFTIIRSVVTLVALCISLTAGAETSKLHDELIGFEVTDAHVEKVAQMLKDGADANEKNEKGTPIIFKALYPKDIRYLELLLKHGADVNSRNESKETPLTWATFISANSEKGDSSVVELLLKNRADVNAVGRSKTALNYAIGNLRPGSNLRLLEVLIKAGADLNHLTKLGSWGITPTGLAAKNGKNDVIRMLAKYGADLNLKGSTGISPIEAAKHEKHPDSVALLKSLGAKE